MEMDQPYFEKGGYKMYNKMDENKMQSAKNDTDEKWGVN